VRRFERSKGSNPVKVGYEFLCSFYDVASNISYFSVLFCVIMSYSLICAHFYRILVSSF
jgi:hypothetical protein